MPDKWLEDVSQALGDLGGEAHLSAIYPKVWECRKRGEHPSENIRHGCEIAPSKIHQADSWLGPEVDWQNRMRLPVSHSRNRDLATGFVAACPSPAAAWTDISVPHVANFA